MSSEKYGFPAQKLPSIRTKKQLLRDGEKNEFIWMH